MSESAFVPAPRSAEPAPAVPGPRTAEGEALLAADRALDAVEVLRHGVAEGEPGASDLLVRAYLDSGSFSAAVQWLGPLVAQGQTQFAGALGTAMAGLADDAGAEQALRLAVGSGDVAAANELAILLRDQDRTAEAIRVLEQAAEAGDGQAPANVVALWLEAADLPAAAAAAERYANERLPDTLVALADVRLHQGRVDEAEQAYRDGAEHGALRGHSAYAMFLLGERGDADGAARELDAARAVAEPGWATSTARFLLETGRPDDARGYLQIGLEAGERGAEALLEELDGADAGD